MLWEKCSLWLFCWRIICLQQKRSRAEGSWVYLHCFHRYSQDEGCLSNGILFPPPWPKGTRFWHAVLVLWRGEGSFSEAVHFLDAVGRGRTQIRFQCGFQSLFLPATPSMLFKNRDPKWQTWLRQLLEPAQPPSNSPDPTQQQCSVLAALEDYSITAGLLLTLWSSQPAGLWHELSGDKHRRHPMAKRHSRDRTLNSNTVQYLLLVWHSQLYLP